MKIFSEKTNKEYKSVKECLAAEKEFDAAVTAREVEQEKLSNERKNRAKEVEDAFRDVQDAQDKYIALRNQFVKDYGSFHMTFSDCCNGLSSLFGDFFSVF